MTIEIVSAWGREDFLAPWFLRHYDYADKITILLDTFWNGKCKTEEILRQNKKVNIIPITYHGRDGGIDEMVKSRKLGELYRNTTCDMVVCVDADEFVLNTPEEFNTGNWKIAKCRLYDVFRHITEQDLDFNKTIKENRRHGFHRWMYNKPIIIRKGLDLTLDSGQHAVKVDNKLHQYRIRSLSPENRMLYRQTSPEFYGAHWCFADLSFCLERRYGKRLRHGVRFDDYNKIDEQSIIAECKKHENDPQLW